MNDLERVLAGQDPAVSGVEPTPPADPVTPADPIPGEQTPPPSNQDNTVIRTMREELSKKDQEVKQANANLERVARAAGLSVEEYLKKLDEDELAGRAKVNAISPELQRQLDEQNRMLKELQEKEFRVNFNRNVDNLIKEHNLSDEDAQKFIYSLAEKGVDVFNTPLTHSQLYFAFNGADIITNMRETIRQEVIQELSQKGRSAADPNPGGDPGDVNKGSLDDLLNDMFGK